MPLLPDRVRRLGRRALLNPTFHRLVGRRLEVALVQLSYLSRYSRWISEQGCQPVHSGRFKLYDALLAQERLDAPIDYLEFGVAEGASLRWWVDHVGHPDARFVGFDSFEGLPEAWGPTPAGAHSTGGRMPAIDDPRCSFEVGLIQDTLGPFLARTKLERRTVVHIDVDLYSSTLFTLTRLAPYLKANDVLLFDELGSVRHPADEFRAFLDYTSSYGVGYRAVATSHVYRQVAVVLEG